jgi:hypothetical protein
MATIKSGIIIYIFSKKLIILKNKAKRTNPIIERIIAIILRKY